MAREPFASPWRTARPPFFELLSKILSEAGREPKEVALLDCSVDLEGT